MITLNKKENTINNNSNNDINQNNNYNPPIQTVLTSSSSSSSILSKYLKNKFEKLTTFYQIFFSIVTLDKNRKNIESIKEENDSDSIIECLDQSTTLSDLARNIGDSFLAFKSEAKKMTI